MQIQIAPISNGFLVMATTAPDKQPTPYYCADYTEVVNYIKQFFPPIVAS